jgi:hypothetical protein
MYRYAEDPLPSDLSYPLKRSVLDSCLAAAGIENVRHVFFLRRPRQDRVVQADYWPEAGAAPPAGSFFEPGTASISVFAIAGEQAEAAAELILDEVLAQLCAWLRGAERQPADWRSQAHFIAFRLAEGELEVIEH